MKRLLAAGFPSCFQLCKSFRNAEQLGAQHNPEFTMLEWYTLDADYIDSLRLTRELLEYLGELFDSTDFKAAAEIAMGDFFLKHTGIDLRRCADLEALKAEAAAKGHDAEGETWEEVFNAIFLRRAEPELANYPAVFLYDYPAQIPCLAAAGREPLVRQRWELYLRGIEIANCYTEERDGSEVSAFLDAETPVYDGDLPEVSAAMPPCSGVALGVDRLLMALTGAKNIQDVLLFPFG